MAAPTVPQLTKEQASSALDEAITIFEKPDNLDKLIKCVEDINKEFGDDPMKKQMQQISQLMPMVQEMVGGVMDKYGFTKDTLMMGMMQIQMHAMTDPGMQPKAKKIMDALQGKIDK
mmetsp:Transcript_80722/g.203088  ORF Transcript_80722/g.203088 Transcript_80722/m.203088 type:complete len:117 (+) Transcript_80722:76-426(+)